MAGLDVDRIARLNWRLTPTGYGAKLGRLVHPPHILHLGETLARVGSGEIDRCIIEMPPRHAKSTTASEWFPVWLLDLWPDLRILLASYAAEFAQEWGWKVRQDIGRHRDRLRVRLAPDFKARNLWFTTDGGGMATAGVDGGFTGRPGHVIIIDDPFKNWQEAHSRTIRDKVWNFYTSVIYTRLEPGTRIVVLMTRWHEDDLIGRLLAAQEAGGDHWHRVHLPALCEDPASDPLGRKAGEPLWPERHPLERLEQTRKVVGSYLFAGMYQQRPAPEEGSLLKRGWWRWYTHMPEPHAWDELMWSWDMAFKDAETSSYVVGQLWGRIGADKYLIHQIRDHMDFPTTCKAVRLAAQPVLERPHAHLHLVEDKANGPAVISTLRGQVAGLVAQPVRGSKEARTIAASADVEAGNVHLPDPAIATFDVLGFVEECATFPNGSNDDQVDAFSQAIMRFGIDRHIDAVMPYVDQRLVGRR
jgi:predicted phage terminase large subunit-like protein